MGGHHGFLSIDPAARSLIGSLIKTGGFQCCTPLGVEDEKDAMACRRRPERPAPMQPWTESPAPTGAWRQGHCTENPGACKDLESGSMQVYGRLRSACPVAGRLFHHEEVAGPEFRPVLQPGKPDRSTCPGVCGRAGGSTAPLPGTPVQQTANSSLTLGFSRSSAPESWIAAPAFAASRP